MGLVRTGLGHEAQPHAALSRAVLCPRLLRALALAGVILNPLMCVKCSERYLHEGKGTEVLRVVFLPTLLLALQSCPLIPERVPGRRQLFGGPGDYLVGSFLFAGSRWVRAAVAL